MVDVTFYKDKKNRKLRPELFSQTAEQLAERISQADRSNKRTQLRKFYDEVVRLNMQTKANAREWDNILPYVNMLIAKGAYAEGRKLVTGEFVKFMKDSIGQIEQPEDLDVFANLFEAFMGFYKKYRPRD
ncbi:type III-A CRISPR-associated protein Csm2 [Desulfoferrobacter suflitae]|uniref:type III-A CRISPR-associated protein Csm2 n=1 Tax=Desulfoferrobacter suflitae TaxID=2865782 RepID=UPI0021646B2A|nr:type III-A CRISPR-associated protein Csm2 [Desulfoferrobacter suflitae]MCK8603004.1 type III-A CRISPR-associated protein Csm2 [Desulfoferrobacter suflitae]